MRNLSVQIKNKAPQIDIFVLLKKSSHTHPDFRL